jgi:hypothetical protein
MACICLSDAIFLRFWPFLAQKLGKPVCSLSTFRQQPLETSSCESYLTILFPASLCLLFMGGDRTTRVQQTLQAIGYTEVVNLGGITEASKKTQLTILR